MRTDPPDQATRDRFITGVERNFSVIAPAGVGKTDAIVKRVVRIATDPRASEWLPRLVVVTYTNRAAGEMRQRARNEILKLHLPSATLRQFNLAFFGTIHSFCLQLLRRHGHHLGVSAQLDILQNDDETWIEFVRQIEEVGAPLGAEDQRRLFRLVPMLDVIGIARNLPGSPPSGVNAPAYSGTDQRGEFPALNFNAIERLEIRGAGHKNLEKSKARLREWREAWESDAPFCPPPAMAGESKPVAEAWNASFAPLRNWISLRALEIAVGLRRQFRDHRLAQGLVTFDDQVELAAELLRHPEAGRRIRAEGLRVILDEAQDTDPEQFHVLTEIARPENATGNWLANGSCPPRDGHFSMVGDPQQSIYRERADLGRYLRVHDQLTREAALTFSVTFRCDGAIVEQVNRLAPAMLDAVEGQVAFVPLQPRPGAGGGQVIRARFGSPAPAKTPDEALARIEARELAAWIKEQGLEKLRAPSWSEVAILCPRKKWFAPIHEALHRVGLKFQIQSGTGLLGDNPAHAWFAALLHVIVQPHDGFEIVGVLREVFGISDENLAAFSEGNGTRFQIETTSTGDGEVPTTLSLLSHCRAQMHKLPLRDAIHHMLAATRLRERLAVLPSEEYNAGDVAAELDRLVARSAVVENSGHSLLRWADELRTDFETTRGGETIQPDAIQLIGCQKAKGLQWHAVILPFLFRNIGSFTPSYPRVVRAARGAPAFVAFAKDDVTPETKLAMEREVAQENQRILYVSLTRARRTLVVVDDSALFSGGERSFAHLLKLDEAPNAETWKNLPSKPTGEAPPPSSIAVPPPVINPLLLLTPASREAAAGRARDITMRVLPHTLARHYTDEEIERKAEELRADAPAATREQAVAYGIWWHAMMEFMNWNSVREAWAKDFEARVTSCPDPDRARVEWDLFLKSDLAKELAATGRIHRAEMPFLWRADDGRVVEGVMDLMVRDATTNQIWIVDWKTDRVGKPRLEDLKARYAPQLEAYAEAMRRISGTDVEASIYSTATGKWMEW